MPSGSRAAWSGCAGDRLELTIDTRGRVALQAVTQKLRHSTSRLRSTSGVRQQFWQLERWLRSPWRPRLDPE
jgi:hypothetical protein